MTFEELVKTEKFYDDADRACRIVFKKYFYIYSEKKNDFLYYGFEKILNEIKNYDIENMSAERLFCKYMDLASLGMSSFVKSLQRVSINQNEEKEKKVVEIDFACSTDCFEEIDFKCLLQLLKMFLSKIKNIDLKKIILLYLKFGKYKDVRKHIKISPQDYSCKIFEFRNLFSNFLVKCGYIEKPFTIDRIMSKTAKYTVSFNARKKGLSDIGSFTHDYYILKLLREEKDLSIFATVLKLPLDYFKSIVFHKTKNCRRLPLFYVQAIRKNFNKYKNISFENLIMC